MVKGHSVRKLEWKEMEGRGDCITSLANAVGKYLQWLFPVMLLGNQ